MSIALAAEWLADARQVTVLTGAGVSAESGIPTFRGDGGYWRKRRVEELATPAAFAHDPRLVWEWYEERRQTVAQCTPNAGHRVLAAWEKRFPFFLLATQNVDGLHQAAGSVRVAPLHGDLWTLRCTAEGTERADHRTPLPELPPRCPACGALERPAIVWFGEPLPKERWEEATQAAVVCDVLLVIGTSGVVQPAASLVDTALAHRARVIEINLQETVLSDVVSASLRGPAATVLPALDRLLPPST